MALDPDLAAFIVDVEARRGRPVWEVSIPEARAQMRALRVDSVRPEDVVQVGAVTDSAVAGLPARLYRPAEADGPVPTVVYFHGGGWFRGDLDTHDQVVRRLVRDTGAVFVSIDYRLAPEHPWPAAAEDAVRVVSWVGDRLAELGGSEVLAVAGDSAGGNLAAIATQALRERVHAQLLVYPATDLLGPHASYDEFATGYLLTAEMTDYISSLYFSGEAPAPEDARHSPLYGDLAGLPPTVVATAEYDVLRDEGEAYAAALSAAGVHVDAVRHPGMIHGFLDQGHVSPAAAAATSDVNRRFARLLASIS
ncbi:alpha/beta hydrolase [Nocardioides hwasunensis]|uniref:Alpha/beta hydrolase n=1 Tax=Nocardioides hwasunensis TaxID=397258 RepID=A0ABR8MMW0_9ACTN|nr:alpha/beta hydrolase [Nocardioides hwasunensis]MBD3916900.1 alpha/beta hydrolase [Nocardioides hwasunensis]